MRKEFEGIWPRSAKNEGRPDNPGGRALPGSIRDRQDGWLDKAASLFRDTVGPKEARAWTGPIGDMDRIHFYHTDHLGSTRVVTDGDGLVYELIDYPPFGEIFGDRLQYGAINDYEKHRNKYTGQTWDYLTGLYYYGARYYDAEVGRFTQADTIVPEPLDGQTFNR